MKKKDSCGFVLIETLIVTTFVAGVLFFLFTQFTSLSKNYNDSYQYNTVEDLYALRNIRDYILSDANAFNQIKETISDENLINITKCTIFEEKDYCLKLLELENVKRLIITENNFNQNLFKDYDKGFINFVNKIEGEGKLKYRLIVEFNDNKYATIRFGENNE